MYFWWRYVKSHHLELDRHAVHNDRYKSYRPDHGGPRGSDEDDDDDPASLMLMAPRSNSRSGLLS